MSQWMIFEENAGSIMGIYEGEIYTEAIDQAVKQAGYESISQMEGVIHASCSLKAWTMDQVLEHLNVCFAPEDTVSLVTEKTNAMEVEIDDKGIWVRLISGGVGHYLDEDQLASLFSWMIERGHLA